MIRSLLLCCCVIGLTIFNSSVAYSSPEKIDYSYFTEARLFRSVIELEGWLSQYPTTRGRDCDDAALWLIEEAKQDGFILWAAPVYRGKMMGETVVPNYLAVKRHFGMWTWIGNDIYYVDLILKPPHYVKLQYTWLD